MNIERIEIDWNEDGCDLVLVSDADEWHRFHITDPEQLYDRVKGAIGPWLRERDEARAAFESQRPEWGDGISNSFSANTPDSTGYALSDPKHPDFHSVHADIYDNRDKTERRGYQDMRRDLGRAPTAQEWQDERR